MHRRYLVHVALLVTSLMALVAVGTIIVDPYFVFGRSGIGGFNEIRVDAVDYPAVSKLYSVNNNAPRTLIFGSSLAQIGLDPDHAGFLAKPVYNAGMPGVSMFVMRRYFRHVLAVGRAQQVILAVDFLQFNAADAPDEAGFERLAVAADGRPTSKIRLWWQQLADYRFAALSANAVSSSLI